MLSSALEKMKAVSVRLRWYRLRGLPGERVDSSSEIYFNTKNKLIFAHRRQS